jgi:hypothetical protein
MNLSLALPPTVAAHFSFLTQQFPGKLLITPVEAGGVLGFSKPASYKRVCNGGRQDFCKFVICSGRKMVRLIDLAEYLDKLNSTPPVALTPGKRARGRPTKAEEIARKAGKA